MSWKSSAPHCGVQGQYLGDESGGADAQGQVGGATGVIGGLPHTGHSQMDYDDSADSDYSNNSQSDYSNSHNPDKVSGVTTVLLHSNITNLAIM